MSEQQLWAGIKEKHGKFPKVFPRTWRCSGTSQTRPINFLNEKRVVDDFEACTPPNKPWSIFLGRATEKCLEIREAWNKDKMNELDALYLHETEILRKLVKHVLAQKDGYVIFEESGTSALALIYNMLGIGNGSKVITTSTGWYYSSVVFGGEDPNSYPEQYLTLPNFRLFSKPEIVIGGGKDVDVIYVSTYKGDNVPRKDEEILKDLEREIADRNVRFVLFPYATREGRILPVREVGEIIRKENLKRLNGEKIYYAVDAVQSFGKMDFESHRMPLDYCDFFYITSSKALGAVQVTSIILTKESTVEKLLPNLLDSGFSAYLRYYQFPPGEIAERIKQALKKNKIVVSLPELTAMSAAMSVFFGCKYDGDARMANPKDALALSEEQMSQNVAANLRRSKDQADKLRTALREMSKRKKISLVENGEGVNFCDSVLRVVPTEPNPLILRARLKDDGIIVGFVHLDHMKKGETLSVPYRRGVLRVGLPWYTELSTENLMRSFEKHAADR